MKNFDANGNVRRFGYDAVDTRNRRKAPVVSTLSEDRELRPVQRKQVGSAARDLQRNFSIAAWAIRKHLDYVSTFTFQAKTGIVPIDDEMESLMTWWSRPLNCDAAGRHSFGKLIRMFEEQRTVNGDVLVNMLADGRIQGVEGDRISELYGASPPADGVTPEAIYQGVWVNVNGRANSYAVNQRTALGLKFERWLSASFAYLHGYYTRFDQVRGVSPLVAAINSLRDVYEGFDYALAKAKVSQLFALAFYRTATDGMPGTDEVVPASETTDTTTGTTTTTEPRYKVDFGKGPVMLDLDDGDRAEFLESKNPSNEFQSFTQMMIGVALKALDIPYSFFDEAHTNYSGARQALLQYEQSADIKRGDVLQLLNRITSWRMRMFITDGDLVLPKGMTVSDLKWDWIPRGIPWVDPLKEVTGNVLAVDNGLRSPQQIAREQGDDAFEIIDQIAEWQKYVKDKGVVLNASTVKAVVSAQPPDTGDQNNADKKQTRAA